MFKLLVGKFSERYQESRISISKFIFDPESYRHVYPAHPFIIKDFKPCLISLFIIKGSFVINVHQFFFCINILDKVRGISTHPNLRFSDLAITRQARSLPRQWIAEFQLQIEQTAYATPSCVKNHDHA